MPQRLVEALIPAADAEDLEHLAGEHKATAFWQQDLGDDRLLCRVVMEAGRVESLLDDLEHRYSGRKDFRAVVLGVEAVVPGPDEPEAESDRAAAAGPEGPEAAEKEKEPAPPQRISRAELYDDIASGASLSRIYIVEVVVATLIAAIGLNRGLDAVLIGAMVIAPLLGPNMALALATTLGDLPLARRAAAANLVGVGVALAVALGVGFVWSADASSRLVAARTSAGVSDMVLALGSGIAGALAFSSGLATAVVGVMVAVALLPPVVVLGLMLGAGRFDAAGGAAVLLATNVVCVNLAAVATFLVQGIRPRTWWEADKSRRATRIALAIWVGLLIALAALIVFGPVRVVPE